MLYRDSVSLNPLIQVFRGVLLLCGHWVSVSVSAQDGIVALGKAHTRSAPSLSSLPKVALETVPIFAWLNTDLVNLVLYARWAGRWIDSLVRCPNNLILYCWIWWWMLFVPTISLILVLGIISLLVLLTDFLKHLISQVVILRSRGLVVVQVWHWYVSVDGVYDFALCLHWDNRMLNVLVVGQAGSWHC